jgi:selenocysteine lyase/cysteine desulfurase
VDFHDAIGRERVEARIRELAARVKARLRERLPGVRLHTPLDAALSGGIVIFSRPGLDARATATRLYQEHHITCATAAGNGIRFAPHIYVLLEDADRAVDAVASLAG